MWQDSWYLGHKAQVESLDEILSTQTGEYLCACFYEFAIRRLSRRMAEGKVRLKDVSVYYCKGYERPKKLHIDKYGYFSNLPHDWGFPLFNELAAQVRAEISRKLAAQKRKENAK